MRRRALKKERPDLFARSMLGSRIPMASLIQALAVAEHLNFRHAANALGVSQSSVSARIKMLEEDLGILLFERHTRGVRLTNAGQHFIERVAAGVDQLDHAVKTAGMIARGDLGRLRIGVYALIPGSFLTQLLGRYRERHPGIHVQIAESTARHAMMQLRTGRLDVTFMAGSPDTPDCHAKQFWAEPLLAALPSNHRLAECEGVIWPDLASETFLVRYGGTGPQVHDHIVSRLAGRSPILSILRFEVERGTLMSMVAQGYGITIVGQATSLIPVPGVTFLPILDEPMPITFSAIWSSQNHSPALRNLLDLANEMNLSTRPA